MNVLSVRSLTRAFGGLKALDDVSIEVATGERRVLIGTNGAGKTTLFNLVNGQIAPTAGSIWLMGEDITGLPVHERVRRGMARTFQITSLFGGLSVYENMLIAQQALSPQHFRMTRPASHFEATREEVRATLEQWHLWHLRDEKVATLSYGVQRQLEVILALASKPRLLLLDEPMAGLSVEETHHVTDIVLALDRSISVLMIEHDLEAAFRIADRVTALDQGCIVADGTADEIRNAAALQRIYTRGGALGGRS